MQATVLARGAGRTEGPTITSSGDILFVSMSVGGVYRATGATPALVCDMGGFPNGLTEGPAGTLYVTQAGSRKRPPHWPRSELDVTGGIQVIGADGTWRWLTQDPISPNDLCFGPDGLLYVTDPTRRAARDDGRIWRCDVSTGAAELLVSVPWYPNGIGFSARDEFLHVASTGDGRIVRFPLGPTGLGTPETVIQMDGHPDGLAFDANGDLLVACVGSDAIQVWSAAGKLLDLYRPGGGHTYTNVALGRDGLLVLTTGSLEPDDVSVVGASRWSSDGLPLHPFRTATARD